MKTFYFLVPRLICISYGLLGLFFIPAEEAYVLCFAAALALSLVTGLIERDVLASIPCAAFGMMVFFFPQGCCFLPLCVHVIAHRRLYPAAAVCMAAGIVAIADGVLDSTAFTAAYLVTGCASAAFSAILSAKLYDLEENIIREKDDASVKEIVLEAEKNALKSRLESDVTAAALSERNRIAREIHDNVGHVFSRTIIMTGAIRTLNKDASLVPMLESLEQSLTDAMTSVRESVHDMHDDAIDLKKAVNDFLADFTFCDVILNYNMSEKVSGDVKYCFLTIIKEALTNVMKHSNATHVEISMIEHPAMYRLSVNDNGTVKNKEYRGIGLANMEERIGLIGGQIRITNENGFRIFISVPKKEEE